MKGIDEPIGFFIEGENIVVGNPCTIPIKMLEDVLKEKRKKNQVTCCFAIKIPFKFVKSQKSEVKEWMK